MLSTTCSAASWYWVGHDPVGGQWFIDNDSVNKNFYHATVWVKTNNVNGECQINKVYFDHLKRNFTILAVTDYDANGNVTDMFDSPYLIYHSITPGSMGEAVFYSIWSD